MPVKELDESESYAFAPTPLRVILTGVKADAGVTLQALDQAGNEAASYRLSAIEMILTPQPRRLRLVATPSNSKTFASGTHVGLSLRTEGSSVEPEQIIVSQSDVGALGNREIAVLEFAVGKSVITVIGGRSREPSAPQQRGHLPAEDPGVNEQEWLQAGRYAFREAAGSNVVQQGPASWGLVLDGSASMAALHATGQLDDLLVLAAGVMVEWTGRAADAAALSGPRTFVEVPAARQDPRNLSATAFTDREPALYAELAPAIQCVAGQLTGDAVVVVVTDGVPADVDAIVRLMEASPGLAQSLVTIGRSKYSLPADVPQQWWEEELSALDPLACLPNVRIVALRRGAIGSLTGESGDGRPSQLAAQLISPLGVGHP
ncbi:MAG: hypothetical protein ABI903_10135 [Actinomycetota bacterium]